MTTRWQTAAGWPVSDLAESLEEVFHRPVDLVSRCSLHLVIRDRAVVERRRSVRRPEYLYVREMRDAAVRIVDIVGSSGRAEVEQDRNRADALMRSCAALGEAAARLLGPVAEVRAGGAYYAPLSLTVRGEGA